MNNPTDLDLDLDLGLAKCAEDRARCQAMSQQVYAALPHIPFRFEPEAEPGFPPFSEAVLANNTLSLRFGLDHDRYDESLDAPRRWFVDVLNYDDGDLVGKSVFLDMATATAEDLTTAVATYYDQIDSGTIHA